MPTHAPDDDVSLMIVASLERSDLSLTEAAARLGVSKWLLAAWKLGMPMAFPNMLATAIGCDLYVHTKRDTTGPAR